MVTLTQKEKEKKKRVAEGNAEIRKREKEVAKLQEAGRTTKAARREQASTAKGRLSGIQAKSAAGEQITVQESKEATAARKAEFERGLALATSIPQSPNQPLTAEQQAFPQTPEQAQPNTIRDLLTGQDFQRFAEEQGGTAIQGAVPIGTAGVGVLKALASRKLALQAAAKKGIGKKVISTGTGAVGGFFGIKALLSNPSKRIESIKTSTTTMGETIAGFNTGLDSGLDPLVVLDQTAELRRQLSVKEENLKLMMIHSVQQQTNPEKAQDAAEEINKIRNKIFFAEDKALRKLAQGDTEQFDEGEFEAWMEDSGFDFPEQIIPKEKGEVPFRPLAKEGVEFATR